MRKWLIFLFVSLFSLSLGALAVSAQATGDCTVRTEKARTVMVRVGPGTNRTAIATLPAKTDFKVLGKIQLKDKSLWWKLDRKEVAPKKNAAEAWVAQADVTSSGDCSKVPDAAAPPIVPITTPPPTAVPGTTNNPGTTPINSGKGKGMYIDYPQWQSALPADIKADSPDKAKIVVNVRVNYNVVESATYRKGNGETTQVQRIRIDFDVHVINAGTGAEVGSQLFAGENPPPFPNVMSISGTLNGNPPSLDAALPFLRSFL